MFPLAIQLAQRRSTVVGGEMLAAMGCTWGPLGLNVEPGRRPWTRTGTGGLNQHSPFWGWPLGGAWAAGSNHSQLPQLQGDFIA
jgi:hypothetical protein